MPGDIPRAGLGSTRDSRSLFRARYAEGFADHAANIAQDVIYLIRGLDVRHPRAQKNEPPASPA